jgi:seryl-tRNA synthetase
MLATTATEGSVPIERTTTVTTLTTTAPTLIDRFKQTEIVSRIVRSDMYRRLVVEQRQQIAAARSSTIKDIKSEVVALTKTMNDAKKLAERLATEIEALDTKRAALLVDYTEAHKEAMNAWHRIDLMQGQARRELRKTADPAIEQAAIAVREVLNRVRLSYQRGVGVGALNYSTWKILEHFRDLLSMQERDYGASPTARLREILADVRELAVMFVPPGEIDALLNSVELDD